MGSTGPNISSCITGSSGLTSASTVGAIYRVVRSCCPANMTRPESSSALSRPKCLSLMMRHRLGGQPEWRVAVGDEGEGVGGDPDVPPDDALDEAEHAAGVAAGDQDDEPRHDHYKERGEVEEVQHDVVGDRQEPLHQWQPPV